MKSIIDKLLNEILKIQGAKIITLHLDKETIQFDISETEKIGYHPTHKSLFYAKLKQAFNEGGGLIIRQFLKLKCKRKAHNNKELWIPEKNLYGLVLKDNKYFGLSAECLQQCCETDAKTGNILPKEDGVHYQDLSHLYI